MDPSLPPANIAHSRADLRGGSNLPTVLLGVGAILLTLFVEFQLLKATDVPLGWQGVAERQRSKASLEARDGELVEAKNPPLQVRARTIDRGSRTSLVSQSE
jgi:hypothetical protein